MRPGETRFSLRGVTAGSSPDEIGDHMLVHERIRWRAAHIFCVTLCVFFVPHQFVTGGGRVMAAEAQQPFAAFAPDVDIDIEDGELEFTATFTLSPASNGIDPTNEPVNLHLKGGSGVYSVVIPAGSFRKDRGGFAFGGTIEKVRLRAAIRPSRQGAFEFELENERANLKGFANPVTVSLAIGDDGASTTVRAKIE